MCDAHDDLSLCDECGWPVHHPTATLCSECTARKHDEWMDCNA